MATLAGNTIASTYPLLLKIDSSGIDGTLRAVEDGDGTDSALSIATDSVLVKGDGVKLYFYDADGGEHISANTGGVLSIAGASEIDLTATAIDINGTVDMSSTLAVGGDVTIASATSGKPELTIKNTNDDAEPTYLKFVKDTSTSAADNDEIAKIEFYHDDDGNNQERYGSIIVSATDVSNGSEDSKIRFNTRKAGADTDTMALVSGNVGIGTTSPTAQLSLVSGTYGFENLFGLTDHACLGLGLAPGSTSNQIRTVIGTTYGMGLMHTASATAGSAKLEIITTAENSAEGAAPTRLATFFADGKVGIGTTSPSVELNVESTSGPSIHLSRDYSAGSFDATGWGVGFIGFGGQDADSGEDNDAAYIYGRIPTTAQGGGAWSSSSHPCEMSFYTTPSGATSATQRMLISAAGDVTVNTGDLIIGTAGKGISFAATADGTTMSSEVLSDYEEGIHTTAITGADTAGDFVLDSANQSLAYTKIGRMVTVQGKFQTSSGSGAGHLKISMPFTSNNGLDDSADISVGSITMNRTGSTSPSTQMTPIIFSNTNFVNIQLHNEGNANETYLQADDVDTSFEGQICISYIV